MTRGEPVYARTKSADDTRALAAEVAVLLRAGDILLLAGELGCGKTAFVQGLARGLGVVETVTSPTFTLVRPYEGRLRLLHADVYRLDNLTEVADLGLVEQVDEHRAVACVEWGDLAAPVLPADALEVRLAFVDGSDDERVLRFRPIGGAWGARMAALGRTVERWLASPAEFEI